MAAFNSPVDALRASAAIQRRFGPDREDTSIRLRMSLNTGPCIAVNLDNGIDYFGGVVNIASKLQGCAEAGQIAMSGRVYEAPGVEQLLREQQAQLVHTELVHAALPDRVPVVRWDVC